MLCIITYLNEQTTRRSFNLDFYLLHTWMIVILILSLNLPNYQVECLTIHCSSLEDLLYLRFLGQCIYGKLSIQHNSKLLVQNFLNFFPQLHKSTKKKKKKGVHFNCPFHLISCFQIISSHLWPWPGRLDSSFYFGVSIYLSLV